MRRHKRNSSSNRHISKALRNGALALSAFLLGVTLPAQARADVVRV